MASSEQLRMLIAAGRHADMIAARYGGARMMERGPGFGLPDFADADDPIRRYLEWCRDNPGPVPGMDEKWADALADYVKPEETPDVRRISTNPITDPKSRSGNPASGPPMPEPKPRPGWLPPAAEGAERPRVAPAEARARQLGRLIRT